MTTLFREKAIRARRCRLLGNVILTQPVSFSVTCGFFALVFLAIIALLTSATYTKKERVGGFISPVGGIAKVSAPRRGVVERILIREGQSVSPGEPLLTLRDSRHSADGVAIDDAIFSAIDTQIQEIDVRQNLVVLRSQAAKKQRVSELQGLEAEKVSIEAQVEAQQQLLASLESGIARIQSLHQQGFVNESELRARQESLLLARQKLANLQRDLVANKAQWQRLYLGSEGADLELRERLSQLAAQRAEARLRRADRSALQSLTVAAPTAGIVTAIQAVAGSATVPGRTLLSILPHDSSLLAELVVPTRAVGFIKVGQQVKLLYDAFDYRYFGSHGGIVTDVSSTVLSPADLDSAYRIDEPFYKVIVEIEKPYITANGQRFFLRAGMTLRADIALEKRSLIDWFLMPFAAARPLA